MSNILEVIVDMKAHAEAAGIRGPFRVELATLEDGRALEAECSRLGFTRDLRALAHNQGEKWIRNQMMIAGVTVTWPER